MDTPTPFAFPLVGSWLFVRSSRPDFTPRVIFHFTTAGRVYSELDHEGKRVLASKHYRVTGNILTFTYSTGTERAYELTAEADGSVRTRDPNGVWWWMVRLSAPEPYAIAFIDEQGALQKLSPHP